MMMFDKNMAKKSAMLKDEDCGSGSWTASGSFGTAMTDARPRTSRSISPNLNGRGGITQIALMAGLAFVFMHARRMDEGADTSDEILVKSVEIQPYN